MCTFAMMILGEMCVLSLICNHVTACRFCAVRCVIIICFSLLFSNCSTLFIIFFLCLLFVLFSCFPLCEFCLCIVPPFVYSCLFSVCLQFCPALLPGGGPTAVNKYQYRIIPILFNISSNSTHPSTFSSTKLSGFLQLSPSIMCLHSQVQHNFSIPSHQPIKFEYAKLRGCDAVSNSRHLEPSASLRIQDLAVFLDVRTVMEPTQVGIATR